MLQLSTRFRPNLPAHQLSFPCSRSAQRSPVGWTDCMTHGTKGSIISQLMVMRDQMEESMRSTHFKINHKLEYQVVIWKVRLLAEHLWERFSVVFHGAKKERCKQRFLAVKKNFTGCNWAAHHPDDRKYGPYDVTNDNQKQLVGDLRLFLGACGSLVDESLDECGGLSQALENCRI